jgi:cold shock CspA family protein
MGWIGRRAVSFFFRMGCHWAAVGKDVFVHTSAVERAGLSQLNEGQKVSFEVTADRRSGKTTADNLRV